MILLPLAHCSADCPTSKHTHYRAASPDGRGFFRLAEEPCWWCAIPDCEPHRHFTEVVPTVPWWRRVLRKGRR